MHGHKYADRVQALKLKYIAEAAAKSKGDEATSTSARPYGAGTATPAKPDSDGSTMAESPFQPRVYAAVTPKQLSPNALDTSAIKLQAAMRGRLARKLPEFPESEDSDGEDVAVAAAAACRAEQVCHMSITAI